MDKQENLRDKLEELRELIREIKLINYVMLFILSILLSMIIFL